MTADAPLASFTMLGAPDAAACEGDACVIPCPSAAAAPTPPAPARPAE